MRFDRYSMQKKILLSTLPIFLGAIVVGWTIEQMASKKDSHMARAVEMMNLVNQSELEMIKMSEALRGYLLNPDNTKEFERKKAADKAYVESAEALSALCKDEPDIVALNEKMADYDEKELDRIENEVGDLIAKKDAAALDFYLKTYMPAREIQTKNFLELKRLVDEKAKEIIQEIEAKKTANARWTILLLLISIGVGLTIVFWISMSIVKKINLISKTLNSDVNHVDAVASKMASSSKKLSEATSSQAASLQQTAASLEEITAMVAKASESARLSAESSAQTQEKAQHGKEAMNNMMVSMEEISSGNLAIVDQIKNSNDEMYKIVEVIKEIGNKTKVINEIVFQTKLLSFNASVEAARAGEHGKGFAVVAEEVGSLAAMSGNAAKEISDMLDQSIQKVESTVNDSRSRVQKLMDENRHKVESGVDIARQCSESLDGIVNNVDRLSDLAREISHATQEQSQGLREIGKAMSQLDSSNQVNAAASEESATAANELTEQTNSLRQSVDHLIQAIAGESHPVPKGLQPIEAIKAEVSGFSDDEAA